MLSDEEDFMLLDSYSLAGEDSLDDEEVQPIEPKPVKEKKPRKKAAPRAKLDCDLLFSPNGFRYLRNRTANMKFKGNLRVRLEKFLSVYKDWGHLLFPKYRFEDFAVTVEQLCHSKRMKHYQSRLIHAYINKEEFNEADFLLSERKVDEPQEDSEDETVEQPAIDDSVLEVIRRNRELALKRKEEKQRMKMEQFEDIPDSAFGEDLELVQGNQSRVEDAVDQSVDDLIDEYEAIENEMQNKL